MAQSSAVQTQGLAKLLKKLDGETLTKPAEKRMVQGLAQSGAGHFRALLRPRYPATAGSVAVNVKPESASINANRFPYVFSERGSVYPRAAGVVREHRRRANVKRSGLRQPATRFMAKTRGQIRKDLPAARDKAIKEIEKEWAA